MKKSVLLLSCLLSLTALYALEPDLAKIESVRKDAFIQADASWWGFDENDATESLQSAIRSGAKRLIIPNMGKPWILSKTVELASNQEIILAEGTVIQAKRGAFKSTWLGLFLANKISNTVFRGEGGNILSMYIDDYNNQQLYKVSEWRHGIFLTGCQNIRIADMTIKDTGGDGIAIGSGSTPCRNVLIENMVFDNNNRLGMGIVSGEDITIRNCHFLNAKHMAPCGGIDMEPNRADESISNILIENCVFRNNNYNAITLALYQVNGNSKPVSVKIKNCRNVEKNRLALDIQAMTKKGNGCKGSLVMENCRVESPIRFSNVTQQNFSVLIKDTELVLPKGDEKSTPAIEVVSLGNHDMEIGGIVFDNVKIISTDTHRRDLEMNFDGLARCTDPLKGTLYSNGKPVDVLTVVKACQAKQEELRALKEPVVPSFDALKPAHIEAPPLDANNRLPLRRPGVYLLSGKKGQKLSFRFKVWDFYKRESSFTVTAPSGRQVEKKMLSYQQTSWEEYSFTAEETGIYRVDYEPLLNALEFRSDCPAGYLADKGEFTFVKAHGRAYFTVPAGTESFSFSIASNAGVDAKILSPDGMVMAEKKNVKNAERLTVRLAKSAEDQVWAVEIRNAVWESVVRMYAPLVPILSENPRLLLKPGK